MCMKVMLILISWLTFLLWTSFPWISSIYYTAFGFFSWDSFKSPPYTGPVSGLHDPEGPWSSCTAPIPKQDTTCLQAIQVWALASVPMAALPQSPFPSFPVYTVACVSLSLYLLQVITIYWCGYEYFNTIYKYYYSSDSYTVAIIIAPIVLRINTQKKMFCRSEIETNIENRLLDMGQERLEWAEKVALTYIYYTCKIDG